MSIITVEFGLMTTPFTQPPCYYSQFILGRNLKNLFNMATLLIWSDFCGPLATGLTELVVFKIFVPHRDGNEFELLPTKQNSC